MYPSEQKHSSLCNPVKGSGKFQIRQACSFERGLIKIFLMKQQTARTDLLKDRYHLKPLPEEGGYFWENFRDDKATNIYYLMEQEHSFSAFHRVAVEETWTFVTDEDGNSPVYLYVLDYDGKGGLTRIELNPSNPRFTVPPGKWFAAEVAGQGAFSLVTCYCEPPFEYKYFELGDRKVLSEKFPEHRRLIEKLTRRAP